MFISLEVMKVFVSISLVINIISSIWMILTSDGEIKTFRALYIINSMLYFIILIGIIISIGG